MKKLFILLIISISILGHGCKKEKSIVNLDEYGRQIVMRDILIADCEIEALERLVPSNDMRLKLKRETLEILLERVKK